MEKSLESYSEKMFEIGFELHEETEATSKFDLLGATEDGGDGWLKPTTKRFGNFALCLGGGLGGDRL